VPSVPELSQPAESPVHKSESKCDFAKAVFSCNPPKYFYFATIESYNGLLREKLLKTSLRPEPTSRGRLNHQAKELIAQIDLLADLLTPPHRPEDAGEPECSRTELRLLSALSRKAPRTMTELAGSLGIPLSTATRAIDKLAAKGLVERSRPTRDRRLVLVGFSVRGKAINQFIATSRNAIARSLLVRLRSDEARVLMRRLARLTRVGQAVPPNAT
jgi:DNA-binding MarR family transcriptional regulator